MGWYPDVQLVPHRLFWEQLPEQLVQSVGQMQEPVHFLTWQG